MTIKEAILQILENNAKAIQPGEIYDFIVKDKLYDFGAAKTPKSTVHALCGDFIRTNDIRIKRLKSDKGLYLYYHAKHEAKVLAGQEFLVEKTEPVTLPQQKKSWVERNLHPLLCAFLDSDSDDSFTKTIYHETSSQKEDEAQTWVHPDMVNLHLRLPHDPTCQSLLSSLNKNDSMVLSSYELKRTIHSDYELKRYFFQAVSNSSWANYGWLVAFDIEEAKLKEEMERLNQTFGIGIIRLSANAFSSKILYPATYRPLDFRTIDKLCCINPDFRLFIDQVVKLINAQKGYVDSTKAAFRQFCDRTMKTDDEITNYCNEHHIPIDPDA